MDGSYTWHSNETECLEAGCVWDATVMAAGASQNGLCLWPGDHARPTLIIIDDVALAAPSGWDAAALHRLAILAKLADAAATFLECGCVLAVSGAPPAARVVLRRHFPRTRCLDDGVLRGAGSPKAKLRDDGARGILLCK